MKISRLLAAAEADRLTRGISFETTPDGVVTAISRRNRDRLLPAIEERRDGRNPKTGGAA